ncbi:MAG: hypothetical protein KGM99_18345, partial [Burkholderiales bacterium]|nr:hypothetical protein [Burkholderiales bacterium]
MIKRVFFLLLCIVLILAAVVTVNTVRQSSRQLPVTPIAPLALDEDAAAHRLAESLRFKTISSQAQPEQNSEEFKKLHDFLDQSFPRIHASLKREIVGTNSLLYTWQGRNPNAKPILLLAHQDVVPIAPNTEQLWTQP